MGPSRQSPCGRQVGAHGVCPVVAGCCGAGPRLSPHRRHRAGSQSRPPPLFHRFPLPRSCPARRHRLGAVWDGVDSCSASLGSIGRVTGRAVRRTGEPRAAAAALRRVLPAARGVHPMRGVVVVLRRVPPAVRAGGSLRQRHCRCRRSPGRRRQRRRGRRCRSRTTRSEQHRIMLLRRRTSCQRDTALSRRHGRRRAGRGLEARRCGGEKSWLSYAGVDFIVSEPGWWP